MARIFVYMSRMNQPKTQNIMGPIAEGLRRCGHQVDMRESLDYPRGDEEQADILALWGDWHGAQAILADCGKRRWRMLHIDNGYLRRGHFSGYYSVSWDARQCGEYVMERDFPPGRFLKLGEELKPWKRDGSTVAVLGFSRKQGKVIGLDYLAWLSSTVAEARRFTKRRVISRPKTYDGSDVRAWFRQEDVYAVVGLFTKAMVEALVDGLPVFPLASCAVSSMGYSDLRKLDNPFYPSNREQFLANLAYHQWTLVELERGEPWEHIWRELQ